MNQRLIALASDNLKHFEELATEHHDLLTILAAVLPCIDEKIVPDDLRATLPEIRIEVAKRIAEDWPGLQRALQRQREALAELRRGEV